MDSSVILSHLQQQFSGQLVLYGNDIAQVLGKSEKAISNLISNNRLPFKVKMVGGRRCVDIFQVAQWLSSDEKQAVEVAVQPARARKRLRPIQSPPTSQVQPKVGTASASGDTADAAPALSGIMASQILKLRREFATPMGRFVCGLRDDDEALFMSEVLEELFFSAGQLDVSYVVIHKKFAPLGYKVLAQEYRNYFATEAAAGDFVLGKYIAADYAKASKHVVHLVLEKSGQTLFHAIFMERRVTVVNNLIGFELSC